MIERRLTLFERIRRFFFGIPSRLKDTMYHIASVWGVIKLANGTFERIMPVREDLKPREVNPLPYMDFTPVEFKEPRTNRNLSITGAAGSGKSFLGWKLLEKRVEEGYYKAWVISPKMYDLWTSLEGFKIIDVSRVGLPDPFSYSPKYFINSVLLTCSNITSVGINADAIKNILTNLCNPPLRSFDDAIERLEKLRKTSEYKLAIEGLLFRMKEFSQVTVVRDWKIEKSNVVWDFSELEGDSLIFYSNLLIAISLEQMVASKEKDFILVIDESHRLVHAKEKGDVSNYSVLNNMARMGRAFSGGLWILSQFLSDIPYGIRGNMGMQFVFNTTDFADLGLVASDMLRYTVRNLKNFEFIDIKQHYDDHFIPIFQWIGTPIPSVRNEAEIKKEEKKEEPKILPEQTPEPRLDRKEIESKIVELLEKESPLYGNEISKKIGIDNKSKDRITFKDALKSLLNNKKVRVVNFITERDIKPRKYYFTQEGNAETPLHEDGVVRIKKVVESIEPIISEYKGNQGWDLESATAYYEFKTGFQHDVKDDVTKLQNKTQFTKSAIIVCVNRDVQKHYEATLSVVDGIEGRFFVCCLPELVDIVRNMREA